MIGNADSDDLLIQGQQMHSLASELFPLHRSIMGDGVRKTFEILKQHLDFEVTEVPTGTKVFDWTVPEEWQIRDAYIGDASGSRIVDYNESNLHVVNYSRPVEQKMSWDELEPHVWTIAEQPDVHPYHTAYFRDTWGFCVNGDQYRQLREGGPWNVVIDASFFEGSLSIAEYELPGATDETVLFHCHSCHPSLANDNLSAMVVATYLAKHLQKLDRRFTYRFVFAPATIGPIAWLASRSRSDLQKIKHGLVLSLLGDDAGFTYKQTRAESTTIDRLVPHVLRASGIDYRVQRFSPSGYDERQYGSPGIDLPVGRLTRSVHGEFPEYHTSADNLDFITPQNLADSLRVCVAIVNALETNTYPINKHPCGEPRLGPRGIFRAFGEHDNRGRLQEAMMWILNLADGTNDLLAIAERSGISMEDLHRASSLLVTHDLIETSYFPSGDVFERFRENALRPD